MEPEAEVWRVLADPARRRILELLRDGPMTTGALSAAFTTSRFAVMNHLGALTAVGLVTVERRGRERWNHLNAARLVALLRRFVGPFEAQWADRMERLRLVAEGKHEEARTSMTDATQARMFEIRQEVEIAASPAQVWRALTAQLGDWWGAPFLVRQDASALTLEPRVGGVMGEVWSDGGGQAWATIETFSPGKVLQLTGRMMVPGAVAGWIRFELTPEGKGTRLAIDHKAVGAISGEIAPQFNDGWRELARRLTALVEKGERLGLNAARAS